MDTNYYNEQEETRMMGEEYGKELTGCLWVLVAVVVAATIVGCLVLFT